MRFPLFQRNAAIRFLLIFGLLLPPLLCFGLINQFGVNVPFADDFTLAPLFVSAHNGTLKFGQFIAQHNEHRMVLLRVFALAFAYFAHGNLRAEMMFSLAIVMVTTLLLWHLIRRTIEDTVEKRLGILLLLGLLLFSPVQAENWTWGFQFALFLNNFLVVSAISVATSQRSLVAKFAVCTLLATLATYSFGNGATLWILSFPLALIANEQLGRGQRIRWGIAWVMLGALTIASYFVHYRRPAVHPPVPVSPHVVDYVTYTLAFLGAHLSRLGGFDPLFPPIVIGALLVILTIVAVIDVARRPGFGTRQSALPWIALAAYALISAALASLARVSFGVRQALDSRYTSFSLYLSVGLIGLGAIGLANNQARRWQNCGTAFVIALVVLSLVTYSAGIGEMKQSKLGRLQGKAALLFANVLHSDEIYESHLAANAHDAKALANKLNGLGLLQPAMIETTRVSELQTVTAERAVSGSVDGLNCSGNQCVARGWAFLSTRSRAFDCVVLSYGTGAAATLFQITNERQQRFDIAQLLQEPALIRLGWTAQIDQTGIPAGVNVVTGWAVDGETAMLYELRGSATLP